MLLEFNKKPNWILLLPLLFSLTGYVEYGNSNYMLTGKTELDVLFKLFTSPQDIFHPLILIPCVGQLILIWGIFLPLSKYMLWFALSGIATLFILLLIIGIMNMNAWTILSVVPFLLSGILIITRKYKRKKPLLQGDYK